MNSRANNPVLFIGDTSKWSRLADEFLKKYISPIRALFWDRDDPPPSLEDWSGDWIFSFKSDLILSKNILDRAKKGALNFHPAPPKYRGIGGYVYSIYNDDDQYGVTCHHMTERIDFGSIISVSYFPLGKTDTASSLKALAAVYCLQQFCDVVRIVTDGLKLPVSNEKWHPKLYTYKKTKELVEKVKLENPNCRCVL